MTTKPTADDAGQAAAVYAAECAKLREERDRLRAELTEARRQLREASDLLYLWIDVEDSECRLDGNGYCQSHALDHHMDGCRVANARSFLAGLGKRTAPVPQPADDFRERLIALCQQWTPTNLDRCETPEEIIREVAEGPHSQPAAVQHDSDCSLHNAPALPVGPCDCSQSQPAVPEAVASDADWNHVPVGRVIGDPVWAGQLWRSQIQGTKKLRHGDLVYIRPVAILSATDSEVKKDV